jgi:hypothetical protein
MTPFSFKSFPTIFFFMPQQSLSLLPAIFPGSRSPDNKKQDQALSIAPKKSLSQFRPVVLYVPH